MATKKANLKKSSKTAYKKVTEEVLKVEKTVKAIVKNDKKTDTIFLEEISKPSFISAVVLEFIGTFLLAAGIIISQGQPIGVMFILMPIVLIAGGISGAHVNPLITIGAWATRRVNTIKAIFYIVAQVLGAMVAFMLLNAFVGTQDTLQSYGQKPTLFTANPIPKDKEMLTLAAEFIGSFIFAFSVAAITSNKKNGNMAKALGVSGGLYLAVLIAGSLATLIGSSAIINPAVAFALQAFTIKNQNVPYAIAIYIGAALIGGILGFALNHLIQKSTEEEK
jgi:aquaporin Z